MTTTDTYEAVAITIDMQDGQLILLIIEHSDQSQGGLQVAACARAVLAVAKRVHMLGR
jgi:hypothetical protein